LTTPILIDTDPGIDDALAILLAFGSPEVSVEAITTVPGNFKVHPLVEKVLADRAAMGRGEINVDWGMGEHLAFASLVASGYAVRITGQDSARGTFSHRHSVLHDQAREKWDEGTYIPLQHVSETQAPFTVIDSVLSEEAVLAFEYGYASAEPNALVIWEAQFGDFVNGAQVVIDQFLSSGEVKWGRQSGLTLMLPHGYEGQGPEHSSARLERYLQLCAEHNMQVCVPTTAAQIFHLLRRQMLRPFRKPLVVMSRSRWRPLPEIPTAEEIGASDTHIAFWQGMWAPKGTPRPIITKLADAVAKSFADPVVIKRLNELGQDLPTREQMTPEALAAYHKSEIDKWWPLIKGANIKVE